MPTYPSPVPPFPLAPRGVQPPVAPVRRESMPAPQPTVPAAFEAGLAPIEASFFEQGAALEAAVSRSMTEEVVSVRPRRSPLVSALAVAAGVLVCAGLWHSLAIADPPAQAAATMPVAPAPPVAPTPAPAPTPSATVAMDTDAHASPARPATGSPRHRTTARKHARHGR
jgi:hypothetical protein